MKICNRSSYLLLTVIYITLLQVLEAQQVKVLPEVTASIGNDVTLPCQFQGRQNTKINQVQWPHLPPEGTEEKGVIIIFNHQLGVNIPNSQLSKRVKLAEQSLMIQAVEMADAGLYTCSISTFPSGEFEGTTKLVVQEQEKQILPRMIVSGVFGLIVVTMIATTHVLVVRIRQGIGQTSDVHWYKIFSTVMSSSNLLEMVPCPPLTKTKRCHTSKRDTIK